MRLQIQTTYPRLEVSYFWPSVNISRQDTQVKIETRGPNIKIEQSKSWAEMGLRELTYFNDEIKAQSRAAVLERIRRYSQDGDRIVRSLGKVDMKKLTGQMVKERDRAKIPEINLDAIPKTRPSIEFEYETHVDWEQGRLEIQPQIQPPEINWYLGGVNIHVVGTLYDNRG